MDRMERLRKMWEADQSDPDIPYMMAQEFSARGEHEQAVAHFDLSIGLDRHYHYAYFHKARSLMSLGQTDAAAAALREGLAESRGAGDAKAMNEIQGFLDDLGA